MKKVLFIVLLFVVLMIPSCKGSGSTSYNVLGTWVFTINWTEYSKQDIVDLTLSGIETSGSAYLSDYPEFIGTFIVIDTIIEINFYYDQGEETIKFSGTILNNDSMSGSVIHEDFISKNEDTKVETGVWSAIK